MRVDRFDRVMLLNSRLLGIGRPDEVLTSELLQLAYGAHLHMVQTEDGMVILSDTCCGEGP